DDHWLMQVHRVGKNPPDDVGTSTRSKRNDEMDCLLRPSLRQGLRTDRNEADSCAEGSEVPPPHEASPSGREQQPTTRLNERRVAAVRLGPEPHFGFSKSLLKSKRQLTL